jgi:hypothetical protein
MTDILEQARLFVVQHAPANVLEGALPIGIVCLVCGIGLSVLGAKLGRFGITSAFALLGGLLGSYFARETGFPTLVCGLVGAMMVALIGYQTFRFWVGLLVAAVLSSVVLGVFGYQRVAPYWTEFEQVNPAPAIAASGSFAVPSLEGQQAYRERSLQQWAGEFWAYATERDGGLERSGKTLALGAMVTGLFLGVLAVRWALILATALVGTALVTTAITTLLTHSVPGSYEAFQRNPALFGVGVGAFLVSSLILQTMLTRTAPRDKTKSPAKS